MPTDHTRSDPDGDRRRVLKHATDRARKAAEAIAARDNAIHLAREAGASLREISEATGIPHVTVKRILDRTDGE